MVFRRKGRPSWYFQAKTARGYKQLAAGTPNKSLAGRIEAMWLTLADEHRAWDLLGRVTDGTLSVGRLYDLWTATKYDVAEIRRRLQDTDVAALVDEWHGWHAGRVKADSANHALAHVRWLVPEGTPLLASAVTTLWLTQRLDAYPGKQNTRRKVHSSWSVFFGYLTRVRGLYRDNPMDAVERPPEASSPIRFYELDTVERIIGWQPSPERRALYALLYGAAVEISVALALTRADVWEASKELRTAGTKAHTRDRVSRVADWAWPIVWAHVRDLHPTALLWPGVDRWDAGRWHRQTTGVGEKNTHGKIIAPGLRLPAQHPIHCARDHWAVRAARVGTPIAVIQSQLGHESPTLTLKKYGRFLPSPADRAKWEAAATEYEAQRRKQAEQDRQRAAERTDEPGDARRREAK